MHISRDFIATKTCSSYEFDSFRTGAGLRHKKCGLGRRGLGWSAGQVRVRVRNVRVGTVSPTPAGAGRV